MFNLSQISSTYENENGPMKSMEKPPSRSDDAKRAKNRTLKRRLVKNDLNPESSNPLTNDIYNSLDEGNLAEFPPKPQSSGVERKVEAETEEVDTVVTKQDYKLLGPGNDENEYAEKAYQQYLATHQQWSPLLAQSQAGAQEQLKQTIQNSPVKIDQSENKALLEKLNYMIHLLEEQQNEKTNNLTEELILYIFLGIFVIFVVDSFTKVGKYTR
jgi:hypothetical protein